ncbi:MAG: lanthionine synthetase LanC family protein [Gammaproteobacteria bacterium]
MTRNRLDAVEAYSTAFEQLSRRFEADWKLTDWSDGPVCWRFFRPGGQTTPHQGWKIHVSASAAESAILLSGLAGPLQDLRAAFKVTRRIEDVIFLNSGDAGVELLGKVVTIYPRNDQHARELITRLDRFWPTSSGPEVQTDLHIRPGSAVSFRYGVFGSGATVVGSTGIHEFALILTDGSRVPDTRRCGGEQSRYAPLAPLSCCAPTPYPIELNRAMQIDGQSFVPLAQLSDSPRSRSFLGAAMETLETVVIKSCRRGVAGDSRGVDVRNLMQKEFRILTALASQPELAPRAVAWQDGDWPVLVMEDFRGKLLSELARRERIIHLPQLAEALARMHAAGFVHGDVKLENAVLRGERVGLIDFELAERDGDVMRSAGTRGHMAPEIDAKVPAEFSRDIFALAGCIVQAFLDISPALLPAGVGRILGLLINEGAGAAVSLVDAFAAFEPAVRPTATSAAAALAPCVGPLADMDPVPGRPSGKADRNWQRRASLEAGKLVADYAISGPKGTWWRNTHFMKDFDCEAINLGAAGIVLGLATLDRALRRRDFTDQIDGGAHWLASRSAVGNAPGLFTGNAGVAIALAVAARRLGDEHYLAAARRRLDAAASDLREMDLFCGSAGVLWASCLLSELLPQDWPLDAARVPLQHIVDHAGEIDGVPVWGVDPGNDTPYLGCAHGSAGTAMALASWGRLTGDQAALDTARRTFSAIAALGRTESGLALRIAVGDSRHHAVGNWCHGVAGYLWAILQGLGDDPALAAEIDWAAGCLEDAMAVGTPTYCHGLAGQLEIWRMLGTIPRYRTLARARAGKVARALRILHHKVDGRCAWVSDDPATTTPDLWIGFLGPATALALHVTESPWPLLSGTWLAQCATALPEQEGR